MNHLWTSLTDQDQAPKKVTACGALYLWKTFFIGIVVLWIGSASAKGQDPIIHAGTIEISEQWHSSSVHVISDNLTISSTGSVTIDPGTIIKIQANRSISIHGIWNSVGTIEAPVIITSIKDDQYGGDTNGDGASNGVANDWGNLLFEADALTGSNQSTLIHTKILYGNQVFSRAELSITNCEIAFMQDNGIEFRNTTGTVTRPY